MPKKPAPPIIKYQTLAPPPIRINLIFLISLSFFIEGSVKHMFASKINGLLFKFNLFIKFFLKNYDLLKK